MPTGDSGCVVHVNCPGPWPLPEGLVAESCLFVLAEEGIPKGEVSITLMDDEGIRTLNRDYFGKDEPTDVIAFALHTEGDPVLGDVYLGADQARRQALELGIPLEEELLRLAIHGTLHVLGYRHPEGEDRVESDMFLRQEDLLQRLMAPGAE